MRKLIFSILVYLFILTNSTVGQSIPCLNFSNYYKPGQDPRIGSPIPVEQHIEALEKIKPYCDCIRIFASGFPLDTVPYLAKAMGFKTVIVGAWLDRDTMTNNTEIEGAIKLARAGVADRLVIGSEVRLRNELTVDALIDYIEYVKQEVPTIPVTTADVYGTFLASPEILEAVDFAFVNIYPFWEGVDIKCALYRFHNAYLSIKELAGAKEIIISETGWPSDGNTVGKAIPSLENLRYYLRHIRAWSEHHKVRVYYFAAFDEPWKFNFINPQEAFWGLIEYIPSLDTLVYKDGVEAILTKPIEIDTSVWSCVLLPNPTNTPRIVYDTIPCYGDQNGMLCGHVDGVRPCDVVLVIYIKVNNSWWIKPTYANPITRPSCDGSFCIDVVTGGLDREATQYQLFLFETGFSPPLIGGHSKLPDSLFEKAIMEDLITRTPFNRGGIKILNPIGDVYPGDTLEIPVMVKDFHNVLDCKGQIQMAYQVNFIEASASQYANYLNFYPIDSTKVNFTFSDPMGEIVSIPDSTYLFTLKIAISKEMRFCRTVSLSSFPDSIAPEITHLVDSIPKKVPLRQISPSFICPATPIGLALNDVGDAEPGDTVLVEVKVKDFRYVVAFDFPVKAGAGLKIIQIDTVYLDSNYIVDIINSDSLILSFDTPLNRRVFRSDNTILFSFWVATPGDVAICETINIPDNGQLSAVKYIINDTVAVAVEVDSPLKISTAFDCQLSLEFEQNDVTCFGENDGEIHTIVSGAELPLTFQWSTGSSSNSLSNISQGEYTLTITDVRGCSITGEAIIDEPPLLTLTNINTNHVDCHGNANGSIIVNAEGGIPPYNYQWSTGNTDAVINDLFAGNYELTITDHKGCITVDTFVIEAPEPLMVDTILSTPTTGVEKSGSINITISGGITPYTFEWFLEDSLISSDEDLSNLDAGIYSCLIIDANGCKLLTDTIEIERLVNTTNLLFVNYDIQITPNPTFGYVSISSKGQIPKNTVISVVSDSGQILQTTVIKESWKERDLDISYFPAGIYFLKIDINGLQGVKKIFLVK
ncbi:MAG: T9SS type A sorting domain-containing protein [Bacteroidota bacterium]